MKRRKPVKGVRRGRRHHTAPALGLYLDVGLEADLTTALG